jgi:hypothetical protein
MLHIFKKTKKTKKKVLGVVAKSYACARNWLTKCKDWRISFILATKAHK